MIADFDHDEIDRFDAEHQVGVLAIAPALATSVPEGPMRLPGFLTQPMGGKGPIPKTGSPYRPIGGIYGLSDPRTGRTMYVGQSIDIDYRYRQHCNPTLDNTSLTKLSWVMELKGLGLKPVLTVLCECENFRELDEAERRFIRDFRAVGECELNITAGGAGDGVTERRERAFSANKEEWFQFGRTLKAMTMTISEIKAEARRLLGRSSPAMKRFDQFDMDFCSFKSACEAFVFRKYPEWDRITRYFFGPSDPSGE